MMTAGVAALENPVRNAVVEKIKAFDAFDDDNDPWGEHDFVSVEHNGQTFFAKIDLYEETVVKHYFIAEPFFFSSLPDARRRSRVCGRGHALQRIDLYPVRASTLLPQSVFTYAESPKAQVANQTITGLCCAAHNHQFSRPPTASPLARQAPGRCCS
jgi:hypothetical protein